MSASFCLDCKDKTCLKTKKPCKTVEDYLRADGIYSRDYIRPKRSSKDRQDGKGQWQEIPFSSLDRKHKLRLGLESPEE